MKPFIDHLLAFVLETNNIKRALDVGAGTFQQSRQMAKAGIAVDAIEPFRRKGAKVPKGVRHLAVAAEDFEYPQGRYDLVVCRMVLQRLDPEEAGDLVMLQFLDTLRSGGVLYLMVPDAFELPPMSPDVALMGELRFNVPASDFKTIKLVLFRKQ